MKFPGFSCFAAVLFLVSCDHITEVGGKVNELRDLRKEGKDGLDLNAIKEGIAKTSLSVQDLPETGFHAFIAEPGHLNIVDYHAGWCPPCRKLGPILTELVKANSHVVRLGKIDIDQAKELANEQRVSSIPDVRFYVGGKLVHQFVGAPSKAELEKLIATHSASITPAQGSVGKLQKGVSMDGAAAVPPPRSAQSKMIEQALKPKDKDWLPAGMSLQE